MATDPRHQEELDPRLAAAIAGLEDHEPGQDLWPGIANRIAPRQPGTLQLRWPVAAAAALALVAASAAVTTLLNRTAPPPVVATGGTDPAGVTVLPAGYDEAERTLANAIERLEQAYAAAEASLPTDVRRQIGEALASLDEAIDDARTRAGAAPTDLGAARYLTRTMQRKLDMLETAATMASQRS
jgi:hypothetical protein